MTIICFITPKSIVKLTSKAAEFIPIIGPSLEFTKKAKKVIEMTVKDLKLNIYIHNFRV